eukprot:7317-Heterococcus_DN1.PRE.15
MASDAEEVVADPAADQKCYVTGPCVRCDFDEEVQSYCKPTGRRQEVTCSTDAQRKSDKHTDAVAADIVLDAPGMHAIGGTVTYQSCLRTEQDELVSFAM